jgi:hypothetical protein
MPSFPEAVAFANEIGWYIHQLWQDGESWSCTLREYGDGRRNICRGTGAEAAEAIYAALANAPEVEVEVKVFSGISPPSTEPKALDIFALLGTKQPTVTRRR